VSERAVDGNTNGNYGAGSCTHTENQANAWWTVDLQATYTVDKVVVYNRVDCCSDRLRNTDVSIDGQLCGTISQEATVNTINCGNKLGRIVKVTLKGSNFLTLCEVEVWGSTSAACVVEVDYNYPHDDLRMVPNVMSAQACNALCVQDAACKSWVFGKKPGQWSTNNCWLKSSVQPNRRPDDCCTSGIPCTTT